MQLLEMDIPMVVALNMMDELTANGGSIDINAMEHARSTCCAHFGGQESRGVDELVEHAVHIAHYQESRWIRISATKRKRRCGTPLSARYLILLRITPKSRTAGRFAASKVIEGDQLISEALDLDKTRRK